MTAIRILRSDKHRIVDVEVQDHSDYAPHGQDIVCAAISALTQSALLGLGKHLKLQVEYKISPGYLHFNIAGKENELTDAILETMLLGLREIAQTYKKHVRIDDSRR